MPLWRFLAPPLATEDHAASAVNAALEMIEAQELLNKAFNEKKMPMVKTRIGIHSGSVLAGNLGSTARMEYTVIGDTVNTASRLEKLNKQLNSSIAISDETFNQAKNHQFKYAGKMTIRGKSIPQKVYTV